MKRRILTVLLSICIAGAVLSGCKATEAFKAGYEAAKGGAEDKDNEEETTSAEEEKEEESESSGTLSLFGAESEGSLGSDEDDSKDEGSGSAKSEDISNLSDEEAAELAEFLSTAERPSITDWEFISAALWGGNDNLMEYFENPDAVGINNPLLVEGDWKCITCPIPGEYSSESTCLGNANIHSLNENVSFTFDRWLEMEGTFEGGGKEIKDESTVKYTGTWNEDKTGFSVETDYMMVEIEKFIYLDNTMYAIGKDMYISGEQEYVVLIRPQSRMELIDTSNWRTRNDSGNHDDGDSSRAQTEKTQKTEQQSTRKTEQKQENSSGGASNNYADIVEKARKKSGAPLAELDGIDPDGTLNIHLYEDAGDHTATWDWYYIDPQTLTGHNAVGDVINLN